MGLARSGREEQSPVSILLFPWASVSQAGSSGRELEGHRLLLHFWGVLYGIDPAELMGPGLPGRPAPPSPASLSPTQTSKSDSFCTKGSTATVTPGPSLLPLPRPGVGLTAGKQREGGRGARAGGKGGAKRQEPDR